MELDALRHVKKYAESLVCEARTAQEEEDERARTNEPNKTGESLYVSMSSSSCESEKGPSVSGRPPSDVSTTTLAPHGVSTSLEQRQEDDREQAPTTGSSGSRDCGNDWTNLNGKSGARASVTNGVDVDADANSEVRSFCRVFLAPNFTVDYFHSLERVQGAMRGVKYPLDNLAGGNAFDALCMLMGYTLHPREYSGG